MLLIKAKYSGFCFGVKRAVAAAEKLKGSGNYILGEIIHNENVNEKLKKAGILTINDLSDAKFVEGDTLLIRTHGEPKSTFDQLKKLKLKVIDCTCPFVKEIHKIVEQHYLNGYDIVIIGDKNHAEVRGINGWCENKALITEDFEDVRKLTGKKLCIVVQTTYSEEKFERFIKNFSDSDLKTVDIYKTICYTTTKRQCEADSLSRECDAMIVIGGAHSNNTQKLFDICQANCKSVFRIVDPKNFDYGRIKNFNKVGVVFGASTPIEQFQEVVANMSTEEIITSEADCNAVNEQETVTAAEEQVKSEASVAENVVVQADEQTEKAEINTDDQPAVQNAEESNEKVSEKSEKSEMEEAFDRIKPNKDLRVGQIVYAKISSAKEDGLTLSLKNTKKDNFPLPKEELLKEFNKDDYQVGQDIRVMVVEKNPLKFSEKALEKVLKEEAEIEEIKNGKTFEVVIDATNKGGLTGKYGSYQVFVPASQIKIGFVKDLEKYVGKTLRLKAEKVESKGSRRQIVGSQRVILQAEKEEREAIRAQKEAEFFNTIQEGDVVLGTPVRFASFGAFVDVNGFDCLAHISDLSWTGCNECSDVLELGKQYEFVILKIDSEAKRVSIGYKQLQPKPWDSVTERYAVGDVIKGKVVRIVSFGAFVEVEKGIDGLVHVSQISNKWLENPVTALEVGQEVEAKILDINPEKEKMTLSIKALLADEAVHANVSEEKDGKSSKSKKRAGRKDEDEDFELREWKDDNGGASIAEMLNNSDNK